MYSQKFFTPLHEVEKLDPIKVLQALYEDQYPPSIVEEELQELLDTLHKIKDPSYSRMSAEATEEFVDAVLNREIARHNKKKVPTPESIQQEVAKEEMKPKSGGMTFSNTDSEI